MYLGEEVPLGRRRHRHQEDGWREMAGRRKASFGPALSMALEEMGALRPTGNICKKPASSPLAESGDSALLSCATGTGKTIAYLAPLCERMKEIERSLGGMGSRRASKRPLLWSWRRQGTLRSDRRCEQKFSHALKFRSTVVAKGSRTLGQQLKRPEAGWILSWAHLARFKRHATEMACFSAVEMLVFDEADTLVSAGEFGREAESLVTSVRSKPTCQLVYVSATPTGEPAFHTAVFYGGGIAQLG